MRTDIDTDIDTAMCATVAHALAYLAEHGPMTLSQLLYTSEAQAHLHRDLAHLRCRPVEQRPWIATSTTVQNNALHREVGAALRTSATRIGWRAGYPLWKVRS